MTPKNRQLHYEIKNRAWLYDFVFVGRFSILVAILLLLSLFIQPINQAFAQTEGEIVTDAVTEAEEPENDDATEISMVKSTITAEDALNLAEPTAEVVDAIEVENEPVIEESSDTEEELATTTLTEALPVSNVNTDVENEGEDLFDESVSNDDDFIELPDTSILLEEVPANAQSIVTEENFYQFSRQSCVSVGNGSYHCAITDAAAIDEDSVVYADRGASGNMEIFLKTTRDEVRQITDNNFDDIAPHYDPSSLQVVWQRLIEGRHQIILYDIRRDTETQLTYSRTNNMEPKVSTEGVVWQTWDDNDWEIFYFDGTVTEQLTDNESQDVAPVIKEGYVLWTVLGSNRQEARVYSLESGEIRTIIGYEGGSIENPRFVLVYETRFDNGDVVIQGFDPATGISTPISSSPAPEPIDIPNSDPIGEIRALVNNKTINDDEEEISLDVDDDIATSTLDISKPATSTPGTLDLTTATDETEDSTVSDELSPFMNDFELTEYDLVLTPIQLDDVE